MKKYRYNTPELKSQREKLWKEAREKAKAIVAEMTLEEKVAQCTQYTPYFWSEEDYNPPKDDSGAGEMILARVGTFLNGVGSDGINEVQSRVVRDNPHHVPAIFANDIIHGYRTTMPIPLAQSCTWDPDIARRCCEVAATEAAHAGTRWTFAPMVDIARDPRWGRIAEGYGEDPFLCGDFAASSVVGFQGEQIGQPDRILACLKHFAAYGAAEAGRDYSGAEMSMQTLHDVYLPSFKAGVDAGAATLMSSFNTINGVPASANKYLLWDVLREMWGFEGFVVSDYDSVFETIKHGFSEDERDATLKGFGAGVDELMLGNMYNRELPGLVREGKIPEWRVTRSAEIIVSFKYLLGLMDKPMADPEDESLYFCPEHLAAAYEAAVNSVVLLENNGILPLTPDKTAGKRIAVIGPMADNGRQPLGCWCGPCIPERTVTVLDGIREAYPDAEVTYESGVFAPFREERKDEEENIPAAIEAARNADYIIFHAAEHYADTGEASSKSMIVIDERQETLLRELRGLGKPIITLLSNGRPLVLTALKENSDALVEIWQGGTETGHAVADVLTGKHNPSGRLTTSFPHNPGQVPIHYARLASGRPREDSYPLHHFDAPHQPLYPFGYGLSYTTFEYSDLRLSADEMTADGEIAVTVKVTNTGKYAGYDVVEMYVRDLIASRCRPVKELKGYEKVWLEAGESKEVTIPLPADELAFADENCNMKVEPGKFKLWIAHNCLDEGLEAEFVVK